MTYVTRFVYAIFVFLGIVLAFDYFPRPSSDLLAEIDSHHRTYRRGGRGEFNHNATKYFKIGMSAEECKTIIIENKLKFVEKRLFPSDYSHEAGIITGIDYSIFNPLNWRHGLFTSINHRIYIGFNGGKVFYIDTSSYGAGL